MTRPETHCKQLKSSEWASPKANSVDPKAPQPVLVPGGAAGAAADEARGRLSGQLPLGTPTLGGSSVIRKESYLGENLRKQRKQVPLHGGDGRERYLARGFQKRRLLPELRREWAEPVWLDCSSCFGHTGEPEPAKSRSR